MKRALSRTYMPRAAAGCLAAAVLIAMATPLAAQAPQSVFSGDEDPGSPIEANARKLQYDRSTGWITAIGEVQIKRGSQTLYADYVRVNVNTEELEARGNVRLERPGSEVWRGDRLSYNFATGEGDVLDPSGVMAPFRWSAERSEKAQGNTFILYDAEITTCEYEPPHRHYYVKADKVVVVPEQYFKAYHGVWYFGSVPVMYLPYWYRDLNEGFGFRIRPGYSSRMGAFLLLSYHYQVDQELRGVTHLDLRSRRGIGLGQDFLWKDIDGRHFGDLSLYYIDDQEPVDNDDDPLADDLDNQRYRIRLRHRHQLTPRDAIVLNSQYVSDTDLLEDFFEREFRRYGDPENYGVYTHSGERYIGAVRLQARLNDFYESVQRLPEFSLDLLLRELGDSGLYYDSSTAAANLERLWPATSTNESEYSAFRFDTAHTVSWPTRVEFVNLVPRAGYRATHYSATREETTRTIVATVPQPGLDSSDYPLATNTITELTDGDSVLRHLFELGCEASFKAFRAWEGARGRPMRHVVEPYANYTFVPEPNVTPGELYEFDSIDTLDREHFVRLGMRHKLQTKIDGFPFDLIDFDISTPLLLHRDEGDEVLDSIDFDAEFRPRAGVTIDADGSFDMGEDEEHEFNTRMHYEAGDIWSTGLEYRYLADSGNALMAELTLFPGRPWTYNVFGRFEFEQNRLEEQGAYVQRTLDCLALRLGYSVLPGYTDGGGTQHEDEWRVALVMWLTAFPDMELRATADYE